MTSLLPRLEAWLNAHYPTLLADMAPGADEEALEALEEQVGARLPPDYKQLLAWHNGQNDTSAGLFGNWSLLGIEDITNEWELWKSIHDKGHLDDEAAELRAPTGVKATWWHPRWIPISSDGMGNNHCLDLAPEDGGQSGQIIVLWHDYPGRQLLAPSLSAWIESILDRLENGRYALVFDDEEEDYFFEPEGFIDEGALLSD